MADETNSILKSIFEIREQQVLSKMSDEEIKVRKELEKTKNDEKFEDLIKEIKDERLQEKLRNGFDDVSLDIMKLSCCDIDRYYRQGFADAINIVIECMNMKKG